jgi:hypothetical protein
LAAVSEEEFEAARAKIHNNLDEKYTRFEKRKVGVRLGLCFTLCAAICWCLAIAMYMAQQFPR